MLIHFFPFEKHTSNPEEVRVGGIVNLTNNSDTLCDSFSLRLWVEGLNALGEPIQIVLVEHLYILPFSSKKITMSGILFHPINSTPKKQYSYNCRVELLDSQENIIETRFSTLQIK